ncbi:MAG: N-methyl-L-tryptophan oxidase [Roseiflexaceae bacterium]
MKHDYEYIVLGLGGIGSAAAYWLARRVGGDVLGLEQFAIGHVRGASQDHSRIIRLSYHTPIYVTLARQAYQAWAALERDAGEALILRTGGLDFGPRDGAIPLSDYAESMRACAVPFESLDADEIMRRWPQFQLTDDIHGLYQAESGIAPAARCNAAHIRMARAHGATLREHAPVLALRAVDGEIEVITAGAAYRCRKLVVAADAWTNQALAHFGTQLPLTVTQEQVTYFATSHLSDFAPERFPIWIWMDDPSFYGFPVYGEAGPKAGQDIGGQEVSAETRTFEPDPAAQRRLEDFLRRYIPGALGPIIYTKTCLYTLTPDRDFVLDRLPQQPNVLVALGAAHGFKFASLFGKILSELAIDGATECDISAFNIDRPILLEERPAHSFMI